MKHLLWPLLLSFFSLSNTAQDVALKVEKKIHSLKSIQANFEQVYYSSTVSTPLRERGNFHFQKPDSMKWDYKEPEEKT